MSYPQSYHAAMHHLIEYGAWNGNTQRGRDLCAQALRDIRRAMGWKRAIWERGHMRWIAGMFPVKAGQA